MRTKISPVQAWVLLITLAGALIIFGYAVRPDTARAIEGTVPDKPFGVELTNTLPSLDLNDNADVSDEGDRRVVSGYTFTVRSEKAFTLSNKLTITFPTGIDLVGANDTLDSYELYDPTDQRFESATAVSVFPSVAFGGGAIDLTFGDLASPGLLPALIPGARGDNITVRITEDASIGNPRDPSSPIIEVNTDTDTTPFASIPLFFGALITINPREPGTAADIRVAFYATNDLNPNQGKIIMTFSKKFLEAGFPLVIPPRDIQITADRLLLRNSGSQVITEATTGSDGAPIPKLRQLVFPKDSPTFKLVGPGNNQPQLSITIPDMDFELNVGSVGPQGLAEKALITVVFSAGALINLPEEARTSFQFGKDHAHDITIRLTDPAGIDTGTDTDGDKTEFHLPRVLKLGDDGGSRDESFTVTGTGFRGDVATVFLDRNGDGRFDVATDRFLTTAVIGKDETFQAEFTVDENFSIDQDLNQINARDGEGNSICRFAVGSAGICDVDRTGDIVRFLLKPSVTLVPNEGNTLLEFAIILRDFPAPSTISSVLMGGLPVRGAEGNSLEGLPLSANGGATIRGLVPASLPPGETILTVNVLSGSEVVNKRATYTVNGAQIELTPSRAVPNMAVTITGTGFLPTGVICASDIQFAGIPITTIPQQSRGGTGFPCDDGEDFVKITGGFVPPDFVATVPVPAAGVLLDAGIEGDTVEVKVRDITGVTGTALLHVPKRVLTVDPPSGVPQSVLTIRGTGFPADNPDTDYNPNVLVEYLSGKASTSVNKTPDAEGNFSVTLIVPTNVVIPSDSPIHATVDGQDGVPSIASTIHFILGGVAKIEPARAPSGTSVTVSGEGFTRFAIVESVEFGGLGALGGRQISTDGNGGFVIPDLVVPGSQPGVIPVIVSVGGKTAATSYEVLDSGQTLGPATPLVAGLEPLGDVLERVFYFDNFGKDWTFYDPRPEFANANTLSELRPGFPYWIKVVEDRDVVLNNQTRNLSCLADSCWNLVIW